MTHLASLRRAEAILAAATPCWRKCGIGVLDVDDIAAALDEAWEAGRAFGADEARRYSPPACAEYVKRQILIAERPE